MSNGSRPRRRVVGLVVAAALLGGSWTTAAWAGDCGEDAVTTTFDLIQTSIFEKRNCADALCHGTARSGGLDLTAGNSYASLVDVKAETVPKTYRVLAGDKDQSLLWLNLAAKTLPDEYTAPLRPMPLEPVPALTFDELELVRRWLEAGAPETGVVHGTEDFDPCLPAPEPIPIKPLPPPAPGAGFQIKMPLWNLNANSEREVCFVSYYDITDQVPEQFRGPGGTTVRYKRNDIRQDNLSHHLIVNLYEGTESPLHPDWGTWQCTGGASSGQACNPLEPGACGDDSQCATVPQTSIACIGYGPPDAQLGLASPGFSGTQETAASFAFMPGVYREIPLKGVVIWNSHAFNLSDVGGKLEAWLNFDFAPPEEQITPAVQIFNTDAIFTMSAPAFSTDEPCHIEVLPPNAQLFELSSHMHQRGKRWRTFEGAFRCIPPGSSSEITCSPFGYDFDTPDKCNGAPCVAMKHTRAGDCDLSHNVTVDEIITGVNIALGEAAAELCYEADIDSSDSITVDEILISVNSALNGAPADEPRDPEESLLYQSMVYNDPVILRFDPPMAMPGSGSAPDERSFTFCALYDNGFTDPNHVKLASTSPNPPVNFPGVGGPCGMDERVCATGKTGDPCSGRSQTARDRSCDSSEGAGDGSCDACPLRGGVTTEDEMLVLLGQFFVP